MAYSPKVLKRSEQISIKILYKNYIPSQYIYNPLGSFIVFLDVLIQMLFTQTRLVYLLIVCSHWDHFHLPATNSKDDIYKYLLYQQCGSSSSFVEPFA